jgi:adipocyte-derived leucine aminopeptidase
MFQLYPYNQRESPHVRRYSQRESPYIDPYSQRESPHVDRYKRHVTPVAYDLKFALTNSSYHGSVVIDLKVNEPTNSLLVHSKGLDLEVDYLGHLSSDKIHVHLEPEHAILKLSEFIPAGKYLLKIAYKGRLNDNMEGFYSSSYVNADGSRHQIATTHFEPTYARMAFPCIDLPDKKAVFNITIDAPKPLHALSNMPIESKLDLGSHVRFKFYPTVKMSTYLVAFVISDFVSISTYTKNNIKVSVYTAPEAIHTAKYALQSAANILDFYQDLYGINYPLPKCDLVAISDFNMGAMENWGLITFRDTALLFDEQKSTAANKQRVATVIGKYY